MRIVQLARQLGLRPGEITNFLNANQINYGEGSNIKLSREHVLLVAKEFAPDRVQEFAAEEAPEEVSTEDGSTKPLQALNEFPDSSEESPASPPVVSITPEKEDQTIAFTPQAEERAVPFLDEKPEVIKAPKIALPGLKVLGKVEIPEVKKKDPTATGSSEDVQQGDAGQIRKQKPRSKENKGRQRTDRPHKNPIAAQRDREAREAEQRKQEEIKREKERRTLNYLKKVKSAPTTKAQRVFEDEQAASPKVENKEVTSGFWAKLKQWFRRD